MDIIHGNELKLQFLEEQAKRADARLSDLAGEVLMHRGGNQHLGAVLGQIEAHRARLGTHARELAEKGTPLEGQPKAEHDACLGGIIDALAYLRTQQKAAELAATRAEAAEAEVRRHRNDLSLQGRQQAVKIGGLVAELERGVPRELVGRPKPAEQTRQEVDRAKDEAAKGRSPKARRRPARSSEAPAG